MLYGEATTGLNTRKFVGSVKMGRRDRLNDVVANLSSAVTDTTNELQALADAANAVITLADGGTFSSAPLKAVQFSALGITGLGANGAFTATDATKSASANLLSSVIDGLSSDAVDSRSELQTLADAASAVVTASSGAAGIPTLAHLQALGVAGVNNTNLATVQAAIASSGGDGVKISNVSDLQALILGALALQGNTPANVLRDYDGTTTAPLVDTYSAAGVTGVNHTTLSLVNSALAALPTGSTDSTSELQTIAAAAAAVLALADGGNSAATPVTASQFSALGLTFAGNNGSTALSAKAALLSSVIDGFTAADVNSIEELQTLADAASAVIDAAATGAVPTLQQLRPLGFRPVSADNLGSGQAAIVATNDHGSELDSVTEITPFELRA